MNGTIKFTDNGLEIEIKDTNNANYQEIYNFVVDELLTPNDMNLNTFDTEWLYIEDVNNDTVYMVTGHGYDCLEELFKTGKTIIKKSPVTLNSYYTFEQNSKE